MQKSTNGTSVMDKPFTAKDICNIIGACKDSYVQEISIGDLKIKFTDARGEGSAYVPGREWYEGSVGAEGDVREKIDTDPEIQLTDEQKEALEQLEMDALALEDPLAYESMIIDDYMRSHNAN